MKNNRLTSRILGIALVFAMIWSMLGGLPNTASAASVPFFSQRDPTWRDDPIIDENGITQGSIGTIGCAMTSTAMILKHYGVDTDPKQLNSWLNANDGYASGGYLYWQKPADSSSGKVQYRNDLSRSQPADWPTNNDWWADLKQNLDQGRLVVVLVDAYISTPALDSHFVVVTGFKGGAVDSAGNYYINDPWDLTFNADKTLLTYYDATYDNTFFAMRVYEGADSLPSCAIQLLDKTSGSQITQVAVNNAFHIDVIASDDLGIAQVRFSSDDLQDGNPTGSWTDWLSWSTSQSHWTGYWDATSKKKEWTFAITGSKEVWAEVKDTSGQTRAGKADIYCASNSPPQLSAGYVSPSGGTPSTDFYYYVTYFDPDGDSPSVKQAFIDGTAYSMNLDSGSPSNGVYRYGPRNLSAGGTHYYFFYFEDGKSGWARLPSGLDMYIGPTVTAEDTAPPTIGAFTVTPSSIAVGNAFTISYTVSDTGGSGLGWVELWRKYETEEWNQVGATTLSGVGNGPYSSSFFDTPTTVGTYWYGIHVGDGAGNWITEGGSGFSPIGVEVMPVPPATIYVPDDYPTIQAAVNAASPGDTVIVRDGAYTENVKISTDHLNVRSENGAGATIIQAANPEGQVFEVTADNVSIIGFTIGGADGKPSAYSGGIYLGSAGVYLRSAASCMIANNNISDNTDGIIVNYASDIRILKNNITSNDTWGILFLSSDSVTISQNSVTGSIFAVGGFSIFGGVISDNTIIDNNSTAISLQNSTNNRVLRNDIVRNGWGISLFSYSDGNMIAGNHITDSKHRGIGLSEASGNTVTRNTIVNTPWGGFHIVSSSNNNIIYANDVIGSPPNAYSQASTNTWRSPEKITYSYHGRTHTSYLGNYWSDYTGSDADGDGIGETPYLIDSDADNYPLMEPFEYYLLGEPPQAGGWVVTTTTGLRVRASLYEGMTHNDDNVIVWLNRGSLLQRLEHPENGKTVDSYTWQYVLLGSSWREAVGSMTGWVANEFLMDYTFPEQPREAYTRLTAYNVPYETEVIGNIQNGVPGWEWDERFDPLGYTTVNIKIYPANSPGWPGYEIGSESRSYNRAFLYSNRGLPMQGSGRDSEGRFIKREGTYGYEDGWIDDEAKIEFYEVKDFPYQAERAPDASHGALGWHILPWRSLAIDPLGPIPPGSIVYVKELDGERLSNGVMLDGYFIAQDSGGFTDSKWLDLFVGAGDMALKEYFDIVKRKGEYFTVQYHENPSVKQAKLGSPGELRVYDSADRVTGVVNGNLETGIPYSNYNDDESVATVFFAADSYRYVVAGLDEGLYSLMLSDCTGLETLIFHAASIPTSPSTVHQYTVDWEALARGDKGVTVQVDADGDGTFEQSFTTGSELTGDQFVLCTETTIDFDPDVLSLRARGGVVTVYIELPEGFDVNDMDVSSIRLNGTVPALNWPTAIGDYNDNGIPDLMVKFDTRAVHEVVELGEAVEITITGEVDGISFVGVDTIRVIDR